MERLKCVDGALEFRYDSETVRVEAWGKDSLRVRATRLFAMPQEDWALLKRETPCGEVEISDTEGVIKNGKITASINYAGKMRFYNSEGKLLMEEYVRNRKDIYDSKCSALEIEGRAYKPLQGSDYKLIVSFESLDPEEKIYGMGQYQQSCLNLKGTDLELAHRNSQASVPFLISSLGYGFLWNNPAVGRVVFGRNKTTWEAESSKKIDYWITAGDTPAEIEENYASVTGTVPQMPEYGLGFWQSKLRYRTQEELLEVAREYKRRNLPISVIVADYFHWPYQGDYRFDEEYWPDPDAMIQELESMGIELMVSVWPQVDYRSENFEEMKENGFLIHTERGIQIAMDFQGNTLHFDTTNPGARKYVWEKIKQNYYDKGIRIFWLDEAEPEYTVYDFEQYRYSLGPNIQVGNIYPVMYAKTFFEGMQAAGQEKIVNLLRCAWAGSQRYGALVWSGDIHSSYESMRNQLTAGLNMGIAGIPWWTTDIGGFHGGNPDDERFRELFVRWFQYGTFCPVMRLHGDREPHKEPMAEIGGGACVSGADNEVWSYGEEVYEILKKYLQYRENMKPYLKKLMQEAHDKGTPVMRPLFYEFPEDKKAWSVEDAYMFGSRLLVAPVLYEAARQRELYLPAGCRWEHAWSGETYQGGQMIKVNAPLNEIPVFIRIGI
ncbi:family 31 glucosidase [Eubacterium sp. am_0171]|uniref:glycoside hydrolase family 31 protein n=1 Tax=unclassified Eubacterium (in: firmicutes) TaxID=2624479 RepID=UPI0010217075|nr:MULTISPECIES: TIM-barrel domain-containing protein [unclassified Eubacterium (in: firmicutes)]MSC84743.1 family 31 glucosidase [Eubacterium sp. BIOML-A1]MSD06562.1 family 31 glucosidase [Eubacterium sp. BIOML-A2]RYT19254.1 family 31 glucosidase [Eubacterium sp. am_0171]